MKLKMLKTTSGSENGYQVNSYQEGEVYDVRDEALAKHFVESKVAEEVSSEATKRIVENSDVPNRGSLAPSALEQIKADEDAGIARPATDRLVEVSEENQVDVAEEKAKEEAEKQQKALDESNYENKAAGNKKGK